MLVKSRKDIATDIARELLQAGVLFGEELEQYIKKGTVADITFKDQEDYLEFEDYIIDYIEDYKSKFIEVIDLQTNEKRRFLKMHDASRGMNITENTLWNGIYRNALVKKRYKVRYCKLTIKELLAGVS